MSGLEAFLNNTQNEKFRMCTSFSDLVSSVVEHYDIDTNGSLTISAIEVGSLERQFSRMLGQQGEAAFDDSKVQQLCAILKKAYTAEA